MVTALSLPTQANAQLPPLGIQDEGGSEDKPVFTINCVGDGISCSHSGTTGTLNVATGGSGGDNVTVNSSAADTTANLLDGDIDWTLADGGAGGPDDITATLDATYEASLDVNTATALSANGSNCSAGLGAGGVDASGVAEDCTDYLENVVEDTTPQLGGELDAQENNIINLADITFKTGAVGGTLRTGTSAADKFVLQAYDVDDTTYRTIIQADAGNSPQLQLFTDLMHFENSTDSSKVLDIDLVNATTSTTTDFNITSSASRVITFPDATDTLVGRDTTDTLTNKTINTVSNTITINAADIADQNAGTDITADLEEETHASEHNSGGGDTITVVSSMITDNEIIEPDLSADNAPSDGDILTYDITGTNFVWVTPNAGTDLTADLEEETHAAEHASGGGDAVDHDTLTNFISNEHIDHTSVTLTAGAGLSGGGDISANRSFTTASGEADFLASGALTCGASTQGKAQVHTTPLQYCDNAATPTLRYTAYGNSSGVATSATALAANGGNCSAGNYPLGVDASGAVESCTAASPTDVDYLVGTADATLSNEIVVGATPGGELGNTWASPTIDDTGITLTSITIGSLLGVDSIDATGAVDMDYGSGDVTDHTFTSDGGTSILDGIISSSVGFDGIGAVDLDYGSGDITDHTFSTDGTGDSEIVLPDDSIGPDEIDSTTGAYDFGSVTSFKVPVGTSQPGSPAEGMVMFDTTSSDDQVYYYDGSRSKWIGHYTFTVDGSFTQSALSAGYYLMENKVGSADNGFLAPCNGMVTRIVAKSDAGESTEQTQVRADGTEIADCVFPSVGDTSECIDNTENGTFSSGEVLALYHNAAHSTMHAYFEAVCTH